VAAIIGSPFGFSIFNISEVIRLFGFGHAFHAKLMPLVELVAYGVVFGKLIRS
jgi:hypothetical protein